MFRDVQGSNACMKMASELLHELERYNKSLFMEWDNNNMETQARRHIHTHTNNPLHKHTPRQSGGVETETGLRLLSHRCSCTNAAVSLHLLNWS